LDEIAEKTLWVIGIVSQIAGWSALIWWDYDFRQSLRYSRLNMNPVLGVPFSLIYGVGYVLAFLALPTILTVILGGLAMLIFMGLGVDFGF
tara:strand:- start:249 stop:521 length:273 start_codon:yes stop_codon:yes gene_type:complete